MNWLHQNVLQPLVDKAVVVPLYTFFLRGPRLLGCWYGLPNEEVCAELTSIPASVWTTLESECQDLIDRHFNSYFVTFQMIAYIISLSRIATFLCCRDRQKTPTVVVHIPPGALEYGEKSSSKT